jgi:MFS family permease
VIASHTAASARSATPLAVHYAGAGPGIAVSGAAIPILLAHHAGRWPLAWVGLAAAGPYLAGALADRYGTGASLAWTAALCAAGAALSVLTREAHERTSRAS